MSKYGLHKIWFFYTDEWYVTDNILSGSIGTFNSYEEALAAKQKHDRIALKNMGSWDYIRDLTGFFDKNFKVVEANLVNYAKSQSWEEFLREHRYENNTSVYHELGIPPSVTDEQLDEILKITGAYFHQIIEYQEVKLSAYVKFNYDFWGKKIFDHLKADGLLETRTPYIAGTPHKGYYLINKPPKGRKSAKFSNVDEAWNTALKTTLTSIAAFPENNFLGKTYVEEWSDQIILLMAFLMNCKSIKLTYELITPQNQKQIKVSLKKMKSTIKLTEGMKFFKVEFPPVEQVITEEIRGLTELLKIKPFEVFTLVSEINGREVREYYADHSTF